VHKEKPFIWINLYDRNSVKTAYCLHVTYYLLRQHEPHFPATIMPYSLSCQSSHYVTENHALQAITTKYVELQLMHRLFLDLVIWFYTKDTEINHCQFSTKDAFVLELISLVQESCDLDVLKRNHNDKIYFGPENPRDKKLLNRMLLSLLWIDHHRVPTAPDEV